MKKDIHPPYFREAVITCACGAKYEVGSTEKTLKTELCSACHPFYTGKQKLVDTARRVEKYQARVSKKEAEAKTRKGRTVKRAAKRVKKASKTVKVKAEKAEKE